MRTLASVKLSESFGCRMTLEMSAAKKTLECEEPLIGLQLQLGRGNRTTVPERASSKSIVMSSKPLRIVLGLSLCLSLTGCGRAPPLVILKRQPQYAPWCAPHRRVQVGQRVVGHVHDGPKYRDFLVDDTGKEHDPEKIADQAWSYLERTGDAKRTEEAFVRDGYQSVMPVVSINPVVVILETYQDASWRNQERDFGYERWFWPAQVQPNSDPRCRGTMQWFSPELKQRPTKLTFSEAGVAEILLPKGKIKLVRKGDDCKTSRE